MWSFGTVSHWFLYFWFDIDCYYSTDLDAIGKPQSGLLLGNLGWLGSYSECTKSIVNAHYCLAYVAVPALNITQVSYGM